MIKLSNYRIIELSNYQIIELLNYLCTSPYLMYHYITLPYHITLTCNHMAYLFHLRFWSELLMAVYLLI
jgi:hypothetical protein